MKERKTKLKHLEPGAEQGKLNSLMSLQRQNDIISMLLEGRDTREIRTYLANRYRLGTPGSANVLISQARNIIKHREKYELENLISLHIARYEKIYAGLYDIGAYGNAANALKAKEKLLQFHREGFHMKVTQGEIQQMSLKNVTDEYNLDKLPPEHQDRVLKLLDKVRISPQKNRDRKLKKEQDASTGNESV